MNTSVNPAQNIQVHSRSNRLLNILVEMLIRLSPRRQLRNPVMFIVYVAAIIASVFVLYQAFGYALPDPLWYNALIAFWLWITVFAANFAESYAEGQGLARADSLRRARRVVSAKKLENAEDRSRYTTIPANELHRDDFVLIEVGDFVPADGQVVEGIASVDESTVTGESAAVIRESGNDRDIVTGGTRLLSDWLVVRITSDPGESFLDRMAGLVEGAKRRRTPNEVALTVLLTAFSIAFLLVCIQLYAIADFQVRNLAGEGAKAPSIVTMAALLVCLLTTTVCGLMSTIGICGMLRLIESNVIAKSGQAVEASGDVNTLLLDKTGTVTIGNRQASAFIPAPGVTERELAEAAELASLFDETPEGRSIGMMARSRFGLPIKNPKSLNATFIPFSAEQRVSGIVIDERHILKGAGDAIFDYVTMKRGVISQQVRDDVDTVGRAGGTPLVVAEENRILGVIHLMDVIKPDMKQRLAELRKMGIKSVMITGDNPMTAAAIASEVGVDDYISQATPEMKLTFIRSAQERGEKVAMVGDGTNDAPALAQADVALVMNAGTQAAKEAGNMVDLDSDPSKLVVIARIGKQLLITRGALTTFSLTNDLAKYFAILPAILVDIHPGLFHLNIMQLSDARTAVLAALIYNALALVVLFPLAFYGVPYRAMNANALLWRRLFVYGLGGVIAPFIGIKLIDMLLSAMGLG